jgi:hypothetical protein
MIPIQICNVPNDSVTIENLLLPAHPQMETPYHEHVAKAFVVGIAGRWAGGRVQRVFVHDV